MARPGTGWWGAPCDNSAVITSAPSEVLLTHLPDGPLRSWPGLAGWLEGALGEASTRWPQVCFLGASTLAALAHAVERRTPDALAQVQAADLLLACACAAGDAQAIAQLDVHLRLEVARAVRPIPAASAEDVAQLVRERLLVGSPGRICEFAGDGPLGAWLRAVCVRQALNSTRAGGREVPVPDAPDQPLADPDPELALLRARHRASFRAAFARAIAALTARERAVLRLSTLDGLTLARIGAMYGRDASTVSRWLEQIRHALLAATRTELAAELGGSPAELESLMRLADSELSVSLTRLLASGGD